MLYDVLFSRIFLPKPLDIVFLPAVESLDNASKAKEMISTISVLLFFQRFLSVVISYCVFLFFGFEFSITMILILGIAVFFHKNINIRLLLSLDCEA